MARRGEKKPSAVEDAGGFLFQAKTETPQAEKAHYHDHRTRLRERFEEAGASALSDYELLEMALFRTIPRRDTKPLAKALLKRFGDLAGVLGAEPARIAEVEGAGGCRAGFETHGRAL